MSWVVRSCTVSGTFLHEPWHCSHCPNPSTSWVSVCSWCPERWSPRHQWAGQLHNLWSHSTKTQGYLSKNFKYSRWSITPGARPTWGKGSVCLRGHMPMGPALTAENAVRWNGFWAGLPVEFLVGEWGGAWECLLSMAYLCCYLCRNLNSSHQGFVPRYARVGEPSGRER